MLKLENAIVNRNRRHRCKSFTSIVALSVILAVSDAVMIAAPAWSEDTKVMVSTHVIFAKCAEGLRRTCVVDGDTLWIDSEKIRIADIDAPEISTPQCASELALGERATERLIELVNIGPFEIKRLGDRDEDRYGRKLRVLLRDNRSLGDVLVSEGLARTWSSRRMPWC